MNRNLLAAIGVAVLASGASATPRETFTRAGGTITGTFQSDGLAGNVANGVATFVATGGYAPKRLIINGTLTSGGVGSWQLESTIMVTPPSGNSFLINALTVGATYTTVNLPANFEAAPAGPIANATGVWTLRFFETYNDGGVDANWTALSITLDDADPVFPGAAGAAFASNTWTDVDSDGTTLGGTPTVLTWTYTGSNNTAGFAISGYAVGRNGFGEDKDDTQTGEIRVGVTPPGGVEQILQPFAGPRPTSPVAYPGLTVSLPAPVAPGTWTIRLLENSRDGEDVADDPGVDNTWRRLTLSLLPGDPPAAEEITPLTDGAFVTRTASLGGTDVKWYKFTIGTIVALDIDTEGSSITDTSIGLYAPNGDRVDVDFDGGSGELSSMSFGLGYRNPVGLGNRYNGHNGAVPIAGTYYLAVCGGSDAVFQPGVWGVENPGPGLAGTVQVRIRQFVSSVPATTPPAVIDLGLLSGDTSTTIDLSFADIQWVKFSIPDEASDTSGFFVDIDTTASPVFGGDPTLGENDTEIGIYDDAGTRWADNDDINTGGGILFSRLSFGQSTPTRPYPLYTGDGTNGLLFSPSATYPATFYVAVGMWDTIFNTSDWDAWGDFGAARSGLVLKIRNNYPSAPTGCSPADLCDGLGNPPGDGFITGTDADFFVVAYNTLAQRGDGSYYADLCDGFGNQGPDGFVTGVDADFFVIKYFQGC